MKNPKILLWLFALFALLIGFYLLSTWKPGKQPILPENTAGWLAYVSDQDGKAHIWFYKPDDTKVRAEPGSNSEDLEPTWQQPDGKTLFFTSDRSERVSQIFHLSAKNAVVNQLTLGGARKDSLQCSPDGERILHIAGGLVSEFDVVEGHSEQLIPPPSSDPSRSKAILETWSNRFGSSAFHSVAWGHDMQDVVGVIQGDEYQVLVEQRLKPVDPRDKEVPIPTIRFMAKRIDIAFHPSENKVAVAFRAMHIEKADPYANSWNPPAEMNTEKPQHGLFVIDLDANKVMPIYATESDTEAVISPQWSPDGTEIAAVRVRFSGEDVTHASLLVFQEPSPGQWEVVTAVDGECGDPQWSPDGTKIAYTKGKTGKRDIWIFDTKTGDSRQITERGDNFSPRWSPKK